MLALVTLAIAPAADSIMPRSTPPTRGSASSTPASTATAGRPRPLSSRRRSRRSSGRPRPRRSDGRSVRSCRASVDGNGHHVPAWCPGRTLRRSYNPFANKSAVETVTPMLEPDGTLASRATTSSSRRASAQQPDDIVEDVEREHRRRHHDEIGFSCSTASALSDPRAAAAVLEHLAPNHASTSTTPEPERRERESSEGHARRASRSEVKCPRPGGVARRRSRPPRSARSAAPQCGHFSW